MSMQNLLTVSAKAIAGQTPGTAAMSNIACGKRCLPYYMQSIFHVHDGGLILEECLDCLEFVICAGFKPT